MDAQPDWLNPEEYQLIIAPSLKVAAELAASRGDPKLYKDLPSMLSLMFLVNELTVLYKEQWAVLDAMSSPSSLEAAAQATCTMVLAENNIDQKDSVLLVDALNRAYLQVSQAQVNERSKADILKAWDAIKNNEPAQFLALLEQGAKRFVIELDGWEKSRNA